MEPTQSLTLHKLQVNQQSFSLYYIIFNTIYNNLLEYVIFNMIICALLCLIPTKLLPQFYFGNNTNLEEKFFFLFFFFGSLLSTKYTFEEGLTSKQQNSGKKDTLQPIREEHK